MVVLDTSAALDLLLARPEKPALVERLDADIELHAPHLVDVEFVHGLRGLVRRGDLELERADGSLEDLLSLPIIRYPHELLLGRMWELRDNLSGYDAAFVALSETLELPLITTDAKLAGASGHGAEVELY